MVQSARRLGDMFAFEACTMLVWNIHTDPAGPFGLNNSACLLSSETVALSTPSRG